MTRITVLGVGISSQRFDQCRRDQDQEFMQLQDIEAVADRLWYGGEDVGMLVISKRLASTPDARAICDFLSQNWPEIEVIFMDD